MSKNAVVLLLLVFLAPLSIAAQTPDKSQVIAGADRAWEKTVKAYVAPGPGCAAAVSLNGETVFEKAFGLAEMEHNIPNTPQTIFESGSVAKQFTAAAIVLLQQDGKLSIDDPVKKYIPEFPDYEKPVTIRHLLNHTAGLRDWGSVLELTGAGRGNRVITQELALDVIVHQKSLDFIPGAEYSYSNSGYNLAAIIVARVSKQSFPSFVEERIFKPLGMKSSSWRDDYQRLVPGRAQAYARQGNGPWRLNMPFMNVVGNGGMLTTVGDWMKWNAMLDSKSLGAPLVDALETQGVLNDGRKINYALGLEIGDYKGLKDVSHGGSTAGYQTFLARYPEKKVSVGVLCNGTSPSAGGIAASITDEIFGPFPASPAQTETTIAPEQLQKYAGVWRDAKTRVANNFSVDGGSLRLNGSALKPLADGSFLLGTAIRVTFKYDKDGNPISATGDLNGDTRTFIRETAWTPTPDELAQWLGSWYSDEAGATFNIAVEGDKVYFVQRGGTRLQLRPVYKDHLSVQGYVLWVTRDGAGKVEKIHVAAQRMRDMPFVRVK